MDAEVLARPFGICAATVRRWKQYGLLEIAAKRASTPLYGVADSRRRMRKAAADGRKRTYFKVVD